MLKFYATSVLLLVTSALAQLPSPHHLAYTPHAISVPSGEFGRNRTEPSTDRGQRSLVASSVPGQPEGITEGVRELLYKLLKRLNISTPCSVLRKDFQRLFSHQQHHLLQRLRPDTLGLSQTQGNTAFSARDMDPRTIQHPQPVPYLLQRRPSKPDSFSFKDNVLFDLSSLQPRAPNTFRLHRLQMRQPFSRNRPMRLETAAYRKMLRDIFRAREDGDKVIYASPLHEKIWTERPDRNTKRSAMILATTYRKASDKERQKVRGLGGYDDTTSDNMRNESSGKYDTSSNSEIISSTNNNHDRINQKENFLNTVPMLSKMRRILSDMPSEAPKQSQNVHKHVEIPHKNTPKYLKLNGSFQKLPENKRLESSNSAVALLSSGSINPRAQVFSHILNTGKQSRFNLDGNTRGPSVLDGGEYTPSFSFIRHVKRPGSSALKLMQNSTNKIVKLKNPSRQYYRTTNPLERVSLQNNTESSKSFRTPSKQFQLDLEKNHILLPFERFNTYNLKTNFIKGGKNGGLEKNPHLGNEIGSSSLKVKYSNTQHNKNKQNNGKFEKHSEVNQRFERPILSASTRANVNKNGSSFVPYKKLENEFYREDGERERKLRRPFWLQDRMRRRMLSRKLRRLKYMPNINASQVYKDTPHAIMHEPKSSLQEYKEFSNMANKVLKRLDFAQARRFRNGDLHLTKTNNVEGEAVDKSSLTVQTNKSKQAKSRRELKLNSELAKRVFALEPSFYHLNKLQKRTLRNHSLFSEPVGYSEAEGDRMKNKRNGIFEINPTMISKTKEYKPRIMSRSTRVTPREYKGLEDVVNSKRRISNLSEYFNFLKGLRVERQIRESGRNGKTIENSTSHDSRQRILSDAKGGNAIAFRTSEYKVRRLSEHNIPKVFVPPFSVTAGILNDFTTNTLSTVSAVSKKANQTVDAKFYQNPNDEDMNETRSDNNDTTKSNDLLAVATIANQTKSEQVYGGSNSASINPTWSGVEPDILSGAPTPTFNWTELLNTKRLTNLSSEFIVMEPTTLKSTIQPNSTIVSISENTKKERSVNLEKYKSAVVGVDQQGRPHIRSAPTQTVARQSTNNGFVRALAVPQESLNSISAPIPIIDEPSTNKRSVLSEVTFDKEIISNRSTPRMVDSEHNSTRRSAPTAIVAQDIFDRKLKLTTSDAQQNTNSRSTPTNTFDEQRTNKRFAPKRDVDLAEEVTDSKSAPTVTSVERSNKTQSRKSAYMSQKRIFFNAGKSFTDKGLKTENFRDVPITKFNNSTSETNSKLEFPEIKESFSSDNVTSSTFEKNKLVISGSINMTLYNISLNEKMSFKNQTDIKKWDLEIRPDLNRDRKFIQNGDSKSFLASLPEINSRTNLKMRKTKNATLWPLRAVTDKFEDVTNTSTFAKDNSKPVTNTPIFSSHNTELVTKPSIVREHNVEPISNVPTFLEDNFEEVTYKTTFPDNSFEQVTNESTLRKSKLKPMINTSTVQISIVESVTKTPYLPEQSARPATQLSADLVQESEPAVNTSTVFKVNHDSMKINISTYPEKDLKSTTSPAKNIPTSEPVYEYNFQNTSALSSEKSPNVNGRNTYTHMLTASPAQLAQTLISDEERKQIEKADERIWVNQSRLSTNVQGTSINKISNLLFAEEEPGERFHTTVNLVELHQDTNLNKPRGSYLNNLQTTTSSFASNAVNDQAFTESFSVLHFANSHAENDSVTLASDTVTLESGASFGAENDTQTAAIHRPDKDYTLPSFINAIGHINESTHFETFSQSGETDWPELGLDALDSGVNTPQRNLLISSLDADTTISHTDLGKDLDSNDIFSKHFVNEAQNTPKLFALKSLNVQYQNDQFTRDINAKHEIVCDEDHSHTMQCRNYTANNKTNEATISPENGNNENSMRSKENYDEAFSHKRDIKIVENTPENELLRTAANVRGNQNDDSQESISSTYQVSGGQRLSEITSDFMKNNERGQTESKKNNNQHNSTDRNNNNNIYDNNKSSDGVNDQVSNNYDKTNSPNNSIIYDFSSSNASDHNVTGPATDKSSNTTGGASSKILNRYDNNKYKNGSSTIQENLKKRKVNDEKNSINTNENISQIGNSNQASNSNISNTIKRSNTDSNSHSRDDNSKIKNSGHHNYGNKSKNILHNTGNPFHGDNTNYIIHAYVHPLSATLRPLVPLQLPPWRKSSLGTFPEYIRRRYPEKPAAQHYMYMGHLQKGVNLDHNPGRNGNLNPYFQKHNNLDSYPSFELGLFSPKQRTTHASMRHENALRVSKDSTSYGLPSRDMFTIERRWLPSNLFKSVNGLAAFRPPSYTIPTKSTSTNGKPHRDIPLWKARPWPSLSSDQQHDPADWRLVTDIGVLQDNGSSEYMNMVDKNTKWYENPSRARGKTFNLPYIDLKNAQDKAVPRTKPSQETVSSVADIGLSLTASPDQAYGRTAPRIGERVGGKEIEVDALGYWRARFNQGFHGWALDNGEFDISKSTSPRATRHPYLASYPISKVSQALEISRLTQTKEVPTPDLAQVLENSRMTYSEIPRLDSARNFRENTGLLDAEVSTPTIARTLENIHLPHTNVFSSNAAQDVENIQGVHKNALFQADGLLWSNIQGSLLPIKVRKWRIRDAEPRINNGVPGILGSQPLRTTPSSKRLKSYTRSPAAFTDLPNLMAGSRRARNKMDDADFFPGQSYLLSRQALLEERGGPLWEIITARGLPVRTGLPCPKLFGHFSYPASCQSFLVCSWGVAYRLRCPRGTLYNRRKKVCDWAVNVTCPNTHLLMGIGDWLL